MINNFPLFWPAYMKDNTLWVLDETLIPTKVKYVPVKNVAGAVKVIREMKTRAFGQFLVVLNTFLLELNSKGDLLAHLQEVAEALNNSRPTFPFREVTSIITGSAQKAAQNQSDVKMVVRKTVEGYLQGIRHRRLERVNKLASCFKDGDSVLTHCNVSGELAMAASIALLEGRRIRVFATQTRPYGQGGKLTAWELTSARIPVTVIPDNAVAQLMSQHMVNKVVIGSDRCAANGDIANKIGSYQIAVLAQEFGVELIVLTQPSKGVKNGQEIPIEWRNADELVVVNGKRIVPSSVKGLYPGFDIVPYQLINKEILIHAGV